MTRPLGTPIEHTSIAFQISAGSIGNIENLQYQKDRADDMLKQADKLRDTINILNRQYALQKAPRRLDPRRDPELSRHDRRHINELRDQDREFRRLLPADSQLFLLGKALLRHPGLLCAQIDLRRNRRYRPTHRRICNAHRKLGQIGCGASRTGDAAAAPDRRPGEEPGTDAVQSTPRTPGSTPKREPAPTTRPRWDRPTTPPKTTIPSTYRRRLSTTPSSNAA